MIDEFLSIDYNILFSINRGLNYYIYSSEKSITIHCSLISSAESVFPIKISELWISLDKIYSIEFTAYEKLCTSSKAYSFKIRYENSEIYIHLSEKELEFFIKLFTAIRDKVEYKDQFKLDEKIFDNIF